MGQTISDQTRRVGDDTTKNWGATGFGVLGALAITIAAFSSASFAEERSVEFAVVELTCPSCSFIILSSMRRAPSIQINDFIGGPEYGQGVCNVTSHDAETSVEDILNTVAAYGCPAKRRI